MDSRWRAAIVIVAVVLGNGGGLCSCLGASRSWPDQRVVGPWICHADFSLDQYVGLLRELAQLEGDLDRILGVGGPHESVHLYLFARKSTYERYLAQHFPNVPKRRALFIKGRGPGMVFAYVSRSFDIDLRHECTHALLHATLPMVPLWLDEGLAEYFEVPTGQREWDNPHLAAVRRRLRFRAPASIVDLESVDSVEQMGARHYRSAWAWVHFMLHGPEDVRSELIGFLGDIRAHTPPGKLSRRIQRRNAEVQNSFVAHFRSQKGASIR